MSPEVQDVNDGNDWSHDGMADMLTKVMGLARVFISLAI